MLTVIYLTSLFVFLLLCISVVRWIRTKIHFIHLINKIPGPAGTPLLGNFLDFFGPSEQLWLYLRKMSKEYYPIYKLWICHVASVFITSPEDVEILISNTKHIEKSGMYLCLHEWLGTGLLTSTGTKWQTRRKMLTPAFHFSILKQFLNVFCEQSDVLVDDLENECNRPYTDIESHISKFTLNSICETAMGVAPDDLDGNQESYRTAIYRMGKFVIYRIIRPWIYNQVAFFFTKTYWKQRNLAKLLHLYSLNVIKKRKLNSNKISTKEDVPLRKKRLAMLDLLLLAQNSGESIDDEGIREEVDTFMFEGHDTTSVSICYTLMLLACHQDIQEKVRKEISKVIENSQEKYTYENLQELKYLEAVLKESLRLYPSVPLISRVTSEELLMNSGYSIPNNTVVSVLIYDVHRNPLYYPDPDKFNPDRFSQENCRTRHPFAYIPFSAGPRNCIGQRFAMLELKIVIAKIIQRFLLHPIDTPDTITFTTDLLIRTTNKIKIKLERRNI